MKKAIATAVLAALTTSGHAAPDLTDTALVVSSTPIIERISEPRQECSAAPVSVPAPAPERSMTGVVVGGLAGAILGHQVGKGSGRTAATAAGAAVGSIVGDRVANPESERPVAGSVVGAAAGGLLGSQVGRGSGRDAAAAAGAVTGVVVGDRVQNPQQAASAPPAQQCRTVTLTRDVVKGYTVVYRYNGRDITTTLPYQPGRTVNVGIGVIDTPPATGAPGGPAPISGGYIAPPAPVSATPVSGYQYRN